MSQHSWKFVEEWELHDEEQVDRLLERHPITEQDLDFFRSKIDEVIHGQSPELVLFGEEGGVNIAFVLLREVRRLQRQQKK